MLAKKGGEWTSMCDRDTRDHERPLKTTIFFSTQSPIVETSGKLHTLSPQGSPPSGRST